MWMNDGLIRGILLQDGYHLPPNTGEINLIRGIFASKTGISRGNP